MVGRPQEGKAPGRLLGPWRADNEMGVSALRSTEAERIADWAFSLQVDFDIVSIDGGVARMSLGELQQLAMLAVAQP